MRERVVAARWLARPVLFALWAFVSWGSLLLVAALVRAASLGLRPAIALLLPSGGAPAWAWLNAASAVLAFVVWLLVAGLLAWRRRAGS
jgi:hypothetical protein